MVLVPDPIFFSRIVRHQGVRKVAFLIENNSPHDTVVKLQDIECPDWLYLESVTEEGVLDPVYPGKMLVFPKRIKQRFIANVSSGHPFFPSGGSSTDEKISLKLLSTLRGETSESELDEIDWDLYLESEEDLEITITIQSIVDQQEDYRGIFAVDFGTTNTCYAYKTIRVRGRDPRDAHEKPATASEEIPSVIFFQDVHNRENPKFQVGTSARRLIGRNSHQIYAYFMSIKRLLGQDKKFFVLDSLAGRRLENRQEWSAEEIAAFILRRILEQAQGELADQKLGTRINEVVATYPTVFSPRRKKAIRRAFELALKGLHSSQGSGSEPKIRLQIDEANAATFNYIAGPMLDHFFEFAKKEEEVYILTFDFGGGTIDVSLIRVLFQQTEDDRTRIQTELIGITGEAFYGGDNVTLAIFSVLKEKLARAIAAGRCVDAAPEESSEKKDDPWSEDDDLDDWGEGSSSKEAPEEEPVKERPVTLADIVNDDDRKRDGSNAYLELLEELKKNPARSEDLIESILPTRWARYENEAPHKELLAKKMFYEIWLEAEKLKLMLVRRGEESIHIQAPLERVACYGGVDPKIFSDTVELSMAEVNAAVEDKIVEAINKAKALVDTGIEMTKAAANDLPQPTTSVDDPENVEEEEDDDEFGVLKKLKKAKSAPAKKGYNDEKMQPPLKILLAGNASSLPIVKEKISEIFGIESRDLIRPEYLKRSVAQGAAEELFMRRQFGSNGFIHFDSKNFLNCLPYSVGLYNRHIGFYPIFKRGSGDGRSVILDAESCRLIHPELEDLALYADYHDGAGPNYLGWVDFLKEKPEGSGDAEDGPEDVFRVEFTLLADREIQARNLRTGKAYAFEDSAEDDLDPKLDPFSGTH
jgi:hypothetical protein